MQVYVNGSVEAAELYVKAFGGKMTAAYPDESGAYMHSEIDVDGQIIAVSEAGDANPGDAMQFCLHYQSDEKEKVTRACEVLLKGARKIYAPLGPCEFSPHMAAFIDKFGIYWCLFTD